MKHDRIKTPMNALRFVEIVQAYGADSARWPDQDRAAALEFSIRHDSAAQILTQAERLDAVLDSRFAPAPSDLLKSRILKQVRPQVRSEADQSAPLRWKPFAAGAACLFIAGFIGLTTLTGGQNGAFSDAEIDLIVETETSVQYADASAFIDAQLDDLWDDI